MFLRIPFSCINRESAEGAHAEVGRLTAELGYDELAVTGNFAGALADWLYTEMIQARVRADDWLLLKESRGMRMEAVLQEIECRFATGVRK